MKSETMKWGGGGDKKKWGGGERCYHTHPALEIDGHDKVLVYGGNCSDPVVTDADIYVGLDYGMKEHRQRYPWTAGEAIHFRITDRNVPGNKKEFLELIEYLCDQANGGAKIHIGCIGGHGRTGIVLAAMVALMTDELDPIGYVRKHYCEKAVETDKQVAFLVKHYHCKKVEGSKMYGAPEKKGKPTLVSGTDMVLPVKSMQYLWGENTVN